MLMSLTYSGTHSWRSGGVHHELQPRHEVDALRADKSTTAKPCFSICAGGAIVTVHVCAISSSRD
jgi:hypothetical protein